MAERFTSRDLGDELIIHDGVTDSVHVLNRTARMVYELSRAGKTVEAVVDALRQSFPVPEDRDLSGDVLKCLEELRAKELVQ
ncbi:MAG TPA: PqqD family protein [Acidobacteriota bacterium]|nr:PqqD family protein [Acidobacteriota bacterium]